MITTGLRFVWTAKAVDRFLRKGTFDPRHTVSNIETDLDSPWLAEDFARRASGSPWVLVNETGVIEASWRDCLGEFRGYRQALR